MAVMRDGTVVGDPRLGRLVQFDERSRSFSAARLVEGQVPRSYSWGAMMSPLNQQEGSCVGHSFAHEAAARPMAVKGIARASAMDIYNRAKQIDPWPGEDYEGTSVLAGAKAAVERGWFSEYRWVFGGADELATVVSRAGPCVIGVAWHEGMMTPDAEGWIRLSGAEVGGHAVIVRGYSVKARFTIRNSWGPGWGNGGDAYLSHEHMRLLLSNAGEALVPLKRALGT